MSIYQTIQDFVNIALENGTIEAIDEIYLRNQLLRFLGIQNWQEVKRNENLRESLDVMDELLAYSEEHFLFNVEDAEFFESELMNFITPTPSKLNKAFWDHYHRGSEVATNYFYQLAKQVNQVKTRDIAKNIEFTYASKYGNMQITINLSKPEKDPKVIAAEKFTRLSTYPACQLCIENEGFYGTGVMPARSNHRIVRLELNGQKWGLQYSPYAYFNEHAIVLYEEHQAMAIDRRAFSNLFSFLDLFPHYMIGSNADLPIVGGSILTHDHYQAGNNIFPMSEAEYRELVHLVKYPSVSVGIVNWPMSVLRLRSHNKIELVDASDYILGSWKEYNDESLNILAKTPDGVLHHTITPIARKRDGHYEIDLVLRDNNVSEEFPDGIFHPHKEYQHIKKENIGLIEVMGLAILPARLRMELIEVEKYLINKENVIAEIHKLWATKLKAEDNFTTENVHEKVEKAVGEVFLKVLENAGVFKDNKTGQEGFRRFIDFLNI
ncbi:UDP-glucose--hexose-1-phosphate uridylyltransferase [Lactovum miscens]|uniref:Galactose-1-phosphate uridylyltransferase n=1 Tax=Lactovum miscens TaxID=190387 RepID=A0A841C6X4_9LACT|nr:UDP-glucose--hexose-1-phosphate uridylyltransferase [Lactovum miscens]MBB5887301.1 UDPglucose--hexose-1-phosphate uridylyltransferase [Lactovum miscens]